MKLLQKKRDFPEFPVDMASKTGQRILKEISHDCMHELFESVHMLKNSKSHRKTEVKEIDRAKYIEELVDAQKFLLEILLLSGIGEDEFYAAFLEKTSVNTSRIENDYWHFYLNLWNE